MADILHSIPVSATAEVVYALVSTASGFAKWWAEDVVEAGGGVELGFFNRATTYRLRREIDQPPKRAEWACETGAEWIGSRLVFQIEPSGRETLVRFSHAGWASQTDYFTSCNTTWGELMYRLKAAAEGTSRGPLFLRASLSY